MELDRNWAPTVRSKIERTASGAKIWASSEDEAQRLRERLIKQLADDGLQIQSEELSRTAFNDVTVKIMIDGVAWMRAAAKMTLGALSLVVDDSWLDGDDAKRLQGWLWAEEPTMDDGSPAFTYPVAPHAAEVLVVEPPAHLISLMPILGSDTRVLVSVGLFGALYVRIGIDAPLPRAEDCWVMALGEPPRPMKWPELVHEATLRVIQQQEQEQQVHP